MSVDTWFVTRLEQSRAGQSASSHVSRVTVYADNETEARIAGAAQLEVDVNMVKVEFIAMRGMVPGGDPYAAQAAKDRYAKGESIIDGDFVE